MVQKPEVVKVKVLNNVQIRHESRMRFSELVAFEWLEEANKLNVFIFLP